MDHFNQRLGDQPNRSGTIEGKKFWHRKKFFSQEIRLEKMVALPVGSRVKRLEQQVLHQ